MSSFNPTTPCYVRDPAEVVFHQALQLVYQPWMHDFFYPSQSSSYKGLLQHMLLQPQNLAGNASFTTLLPSDSSSFSKSNPAHLPSDPSSFYKSMRFLLLPSFSVGPVSIAYGVSQYFATSVRLCESPFIASIVRHDERGVFFFLAELDNGLTEVSVTRLHSPANREIVFMMLATAPFRAVMDKLAKGGAYDECLMQQALIYTAYSLQSCTCPWCSKRSAACQCRINLVQHRSPIDFNADVANLVSYTGSYCGVSHNSLYEGGVNLYNQKSNVSLTVGFFCEAPEVRKLETWALWSTLQGRENLFRLVRPNAGTGASGSERVGGGNLGMGHGLTQSLSGRAEEFPESGGTNSATFRQEHSDRSHVAPGLDETRALEEAAIIIDPRLSSTVHVSAVEAVEVAQSANTTEQAQRFRPVGVACEPTTLPVQQPQLIPNCSQPMSLDEPAIPPKRIGRPRAPKRPRAIPLVPIMPAMKPTAMNVASTARVEKETNVHSQGAARMLKLRKQRNRLSAFRSNEKKQGEIQELEQNLEDAKKRVERLREVESELAEANLALKRVLEGSSVNGSVHDRQ